MGASLVADVLVGGSTGKNFTQQQGVERLARRGWAAALWVDLAGCD